MRKLIFFLMLSILMGCAAKVDYLYKNEKLVPKIDAKRYSSIGIVIMGDEIEGLYDAITKDVQKFYGDKAKVLPISEKSISLKGDKKPRTKSFIRRGSAAPESMTCTIVQTGRYYRVKEILIRNAEPSNYEPIIKVVNDWWGGRKMSDMLPKLFFVHFQATSFVAEQNRKIVGFVTGFVSQIFPNEAYIHFVGVTPGLRISGLAKGLCA